MSQLLRQLAFRFADDKATEVILSRCGIQVLDCIPWRDTNVVIGQSDVVWEVKYLQMRGLLCHHPMIHNLVRIRREYEKTV